VDTRQAKGRHGHLPDRPHLHVTPLASDVLATRQQSADVYRRVLAGDLLDHHVQP
jgi:hypothetical protein